jgi:hypothetical protein
MISAANRRLLLSGNRCGILDVHCLMSIINFHINAEYRIFYNQQGFLK